MIVRLVTLLLLVAIGGEQDAGRRENAYRSNNVGVAYLEQYNFDAATAAFRRALADDQDLALARLNLGIALFYAGQADAARPELERARTALPDRPHADYVLGLIARAGDNQEEALAAFTRAQRLDATDPGIAINIGQLHLQQRRYADALTAFKVAGTAEPYNATAAYGLATALMRSGAAEEGKPAMERFEKLRESGYATTFSQAYLEQGRYAEAIASTGTEPGLVDERTPAVRFINETAAAFPKAATGAGAIALLDFDGDGDLDLADGGGAALRLSRNDAGRFVDVTKAMMADAPAGPLTGILGGDVDNDGNDDLLVFAAAGPPRLYRQEPSHRFVEIAASGLPRLAATRTAAWLDADHDGDLDLAVAGIGAAQAAATYLLRNDGSGRFTDITATAGFVPARAIVSLVPTDFDNRRDVDVLMASSAGAPLLFRNLRDGSFRDVAQDAGLAAGGAASALAVGDVNKDTYPDVFFGRPGGAGAFAASDGRGGFALAGLAAATDVRAAQFLDYDNDGLLDLLTAGGQGLRLLRNLGTRWVDVSAQAIAAAASDPGDTPSLATGDIDGDGDLDLLMRSRDGLTFLRNDGASRARSLTVHLQPRVTNRTAAGTKIEVRAGSLRQRLETFAATPSPAPADIVFGFGTRSGADVARVLWPSGILQAETAAADNTPSFLSGILKVEELDRKPSSCPYVFTWNGKRFEFITDFLGGGEMGYWLAPDLRNSPDPDEYVRIDGRALQPRDGRYELRVTNELEEALFLDRSQLVAIAHPDAVDVYPNEGLRSRRDPFELYVVSGRRAPLAAEDGHGHDVLDRVIHADRRYVDDFALESVRGYAAEHSITITLPPLDPARRLLLLTGWTDYAFSGDNVAAHQRGLALHPPSLQAMDAGGRWQTVIPEIGFPVGRPQTVVVDLSKHVPPSAQRVRIVTTMRVYWDQIAVGTRESANAVKMATIEPQASSLSWRGFSAYQTPDGKEPYGFDYDTVSTLSPWKLLTGRYTREGDVLPLLTSTDDRFVVARTGDEIALSFDASAAPAAPKGWTRTFLFFADGFSKEMDLNSASPDTLEPLPYHAMTTYPYAAAAGPYERGIHREYVERYNTRVVKRSIPPLELSGSERASTRVDGAGPQGPRR